MELNINPEYQNLIPPLTEKEHQGLAYSLENEGCRDAILIWNDTIIDGHNRYKICKDGGIDFRVDVLHFDNTDEAKIWIIRNQFARRNLKIEDRIELALRLEDFFKDKAKEKQLTTLKKGVAPVKQNSAERELNTREEVAKIAGVSHDSVSKYKKIREAGKVSEIKAGKSINEVHKEIVREENKRKIIMDRHTTLLNTDDNLYLGDCLEILKSVLDKSISMVLTDPPYGIDFVSNHRIEKYKEITNDNDNMLILMNKVLPLLNLKMKDNASLYLFSSWKVIDIVLPLIKKYFRVKNLLVWNKNNWSMGDLNNYAEKYEFIIYADKGNHKLVSDKRPLNVLEFNRTTNKHHPTEKPVGLLEYLIEHSTIKGELICDPFMGSGSSIVAAKNTNRNYLGVEINEEHYETTLRRLQCQ